MEKSLPLLMLLCLMLIFSVVRAEENPFDAAQGLVNQAGNAVGEAKNTTEDAQHAAENAVNAATSTANNTQQAATDIANTASTAINNTTQTAEGVANATTSAVGSSGPNRVGSMVVGLFGLMIVMSSV